MTSATVSLCDVDYKQGEQVILDHIRFTVEPGHLLGIIGPNGAGKSTLLSVITGLIPATVGHVELFGKRLRRSNRKRLLRDVAFLSQMHHSTSTMPISVRDVMAMGLRGYTAPLWHRTLKQDQVISSLDSVGMADKVNHDFYTLSGGQQQRVRLARALVSSPKLLLLDEPSAGLDSAGQEQLYHQLRHLCDSKNMAIIMVEHDIAAISSYVDSVACLNKSIHHHAMQGEAIPDHVWHGMYGEHTNIMAHDSHCIGCES
ncbi:MAG: ABC transporter ATP-binding protein [Mariprofundaceae bacterium]